MRKIFLLESEVNGKPIETLILNTDATTQDIQNFIDLCKCQWEAWEENDIGDYDEDCDFYAFESKKEYVAWATFEKFDGENIMYDDILYY